ncbi:uncharacterized protein LOC112452015 [Temnothorax curvispinosus]|uniref:Odorant receptor n=1 Tax=Temnothorax curvispinosus TaxID=300111 RepID=A0A6J1PEU9_9HYME|nr:uncharacterized protein LOC112452015 [Temnothorax curvispinosus]
MESPKYNGYQDFEWAVKLNRFILNLIGLWPKTVQNSRQRLMCNFRVLVILLSLTLGLLIPSIHSLTRIFGDIILMLDNLQYTLPLISCLIRIVIFWWKKEAIIPVVNMIAEDWLKVKSAQDRSVMIKRARSARIIITFAFCIMGTGVFYLIVLPIFGISMRDTTNITDPGRLIPLQTYYIYDVTNSPQYELTYISQSIYIIVGMMSYSGIDNFLGLLVFHICGQLEILKNRLSSFDKCVNSHEIRICIIRHMQIDTSPETTFDMNSSKYTAYRDFKWAVKLNRFTLDFIGLWPKTAQNPRQKLMCNFRALVAFLTISFGVLIPSIHSFIRIYGDVMLMIDNLQFTLPATSCAARIMIFWWKKEAIIPIIDMIAEDWGKSKNVQERNIMIRRAQTARIIITCAYCIMGVACLFVIILPIFGVSTRLTPNITDPGKFSIYPAN